MNQAKKKIFLISSVFMILFRLYGGDDRPILIQNKVNYPISIEDDRGQKPGSENRKIELTRPLRKVIVGELGCALAIQRMGLIKQVVGAGHWIIHEIPGYENIASIGGNNGINIEKVIALQPELFIDFKGHSDSSSRLLQEAGIRIYSVGNIKNLEHIQKHIRHLGLMFNTPLKAEEIINEMDHIIDQVRSQVTQLKRSGRKMPLVFMFGYVKDKKSLNSWSPGADTIVADLIDKAGGRSLLAEQGIKGWPEYSVEALIAADPDIILLPQGENEFHSIREFTGNRLVKNMQAVKNRRVYLIDKKLIFQLSYKNVYALRQMVRFIHGLELKSAPDH